VVGHGDPVEPGVRISMGDLAQAARPAWIDPVTGELAGHTRRYEKRFSDLREVFLDADALEERVREEPGRLAYEVFEYRLSEEAGDIVFGTSILFAGMVGREFNMTRGHRHRAADRAELYYCLAGHGVLLLQADDGTAHAVDLTPGSAAYVPPFAQHRTVNVAESPLITLFCYPSDAGQDYDTIERHGGMSQIVVADGERGWGMEPNPRFRPSSPKASIPAGTVDHD
jgi:glucose-6-phosphate isomerase